MSTAKMAITITTFRRRLGLRYAGGVCTVFTEGDGSIGDSLLSSGAEWDGVSLAMSFPSEIVFDAFLGNAQSAGQRIFCEVEAVDTRYVPVVCPRSVLL